MRITKMQNNLLIVLIIVLPLTLQVNPFSKTSNTAFSQVKTGTDARQTDKFSGAQESTLKITSSLSGFVKGKVFDNVTGAGIPDIDVTLKQSDLTVASDKTAEDGTFFVHLLPGSYTITVAKSGFLENKSDIKVLAFETVIKNINMAPAISFPSTPLPGEEPPSLRCKGGGSPSSIEVFPASLTIRPGDTKKARVHVSRDKRGGCSIDVNVNCISGCDKIEIEADTVTTNRRGFATIAIKVRARQEGVAVITVSIEDFEEIFLPVVISNERQ